MKGESAIISLGYYLVGRHDEEVEPFFCKVIIDDNGEKFIVHHIDQKTIDCAIECISDWYWHLMDENSVPDNWDNYPPSIKEPPL